jgi:tyrosine-protein kinase Etk/Wzc
MNHPDQPQHQPGRPIDDAGFGEGLSIVEYVTILLDEWRILIAPLILALLGAGLYLLLAVPRYNASGIIQVSSQDGGSSNALLDLAGGSPSPLETEVEILRSRRIISKALQFLSLNITQPTPKITFDVGISLQGKSPVADDLNFLRSRIKKLEVADWVEQPVAATIVNNEDSSLSIRLKSDKEATTVAPGQEFSKHGISFSVVKGTGPTANKEMRLKIVPSDLAAENTHRNLKIESIGSSRKDTSLVRISFENADRVIARNLVNAIMESYMAFALDWRTMQADRSAAFIEKQLDDLKSSLDSSEHDLQIFIEENSAVMLPEQARSLINSSAALELESRKVGIQEDLLRMVSASLTRSAKNGTQASLAGDFLFDDELLGKAIGVLNDLEMRRETLLAEVTDAHPDIIRLEKEISRVRTQVKELINSSRSRTKERLQSLDRSLDTIKDQLSEFPAKERHLAMLRRNLEVTQDLYKFLMTKLEESRIVKASTTTDKRIIDRATTPFRRSHPRRLATVVLASILGLLLGIVAVFARRTLDPRIRDEEEAKALVALPIYGAIPDLKILEIIKQDQPSVNTIWEAPKGPAAESFRTIRTNVEFAQVDKESLKVIQITSSEASEGKSTIIANLAVALSRAGHKVLIVDLDLRRPSQHRFWDLPRTPGISDHLVGRAEISVLKSDKFGVFFVPAGNEPPESQRLLASDRLSELIADWREEYDYVLLDTPPLLVADSLVISRLSDMMLFVIRPRHCRRSHLKIAQNTHDRMDIVKGLVINGVSTRRGGYYHYYRGSYYGTKTSDTQEQ